MTQKPFEELTIADDTAKQCTSCTKNVQGSTFFDSTALQANSRSLFFHAFLTIFRSFVVFFTA